VTRVLARHVLSRYVGVEPAALAFATNAYGRPRVANPAAASAAVRFNISHTNGLIALAVASGREVGVDVENVRDREATIDIADRFFAPDEVGALREESVENQAFRFFEYWTFKESYIKARGMGLSIPLDKFSFKFPARERVELSIGAELEDDPRRWAFVQLMPTREHLLAACVERSAGSRPSLIVRKFGPGEMDGAGPIEIATPLRTSEWTTKDPCAN
jgi:4'-phosphopantetheinyl transferase